MINFESVSKTYPGGKCALHDVDLSVEAGEWVWLAGSAGAGKSTLMHIAAALLAHDLGTVTVCQQSLATASERKRRQLRANIGLIKQHPTLLMDQSLLANVALPLAIHEPTANPLRRVCAALDKVGLLDKIELTPAQLSGSERQCVAIARALVHKPALILADDPTAHLDTAQARMVIELLQQFQRMGCTVVVATQDFELTAHVDARIVQLHQGKIQLPMPNFHYQGPIHATEHVLAELDDCPL